MYIKYKTHNTQLYKLSGNWQIWQFHSFTDSM